MALGKCPLCNKYYDNLKHESCPYCFQNADLGVPWENGQKTLSLGEETQQPEDDNAKTQAYEDGTSADEKTIGIYFGNEGFDPVTGWILCVRGTVRGKSYELHMNRNFIGRDKLMDVSIPDDLLISRKNHLSVIYDGKTHSFFVKPENGSVAINGTSVVHPVPVHENDILSFGNSSYIFIPYCTEERNWDDGREK